jgi:hypothetical protein
LPPAWRERVLENPLFYAAQIGLRVFEASGIALFPGPLTVSLSFSLALPLAPYGFYGT